MMHYIAILLLGMRGLVQHRPMSTFLLFEKMKKKKDYCNFFDILKSILFLCISKIDINILMFSEFVYAAFSPKKM